MVKRKDLEMKDMSTEKFLNILKTGVVKEMEKFLTEHPQFRVNTLFPELNGETALLRAIRSENEPLVEVLLKNGTNSYQFFHKFGKSSLHFASEVANARILQALLRNLPPEQRNKVNEKDSKEGKTAVIILTEAAILGPQDIKKKARTCLEMLLGEANSELDLDAQNGRGHSPLSLAAASGPEGIISLLLKSGCHPDLPTVYGSTSRQIISNRYPNFDWSPCNPIVSIGVGDNPIQKLEKAVRFRSLSTLYELITDGSLAHPLPWNHVMSHGNKTLTLLQYACIHSYHEIAKFLLQTGANPDLTGTLVDPAGFLAAKARSVSMLEVLVEDGRVDWNHVVVDEGDKTQYNILHVLLSTDINPWMNHNDLNWTVIRQTHNCLVLLGPLMSKKTLNARRMPSLCTPLHLATTWPGQGIIRYLLQTDAQDSLLVTNLSDWHPMSRIQTNTLREYFDSKISFENSPTEKKFKITLNHQVLLPIKRKGDQPGDLKGLLLPKLTSNNFCYTDYSDQDVPELYNLIKLSKKHHDLMDHPVVSSMIWLKWIHFQKVNKMSPILIALRIFFHICVTGFVMSHFGGRSLFMLECPALPTSPAYVQFNCNPVSLMTAFRILILIGWVGNLLQIFITYLLKIGKSWTGTKARIRSSVTLEFVITVLMTALIPLIAIENPLKKERFGLSVNYCRDVAGFLLLLSCGDLCFLIRDHLPYRKAAAMINWTVIVSSSMAWFLVVHIFLVVGFALGFYIQLHTDCVDQSGVFQNCTSAPSVQDTEKPLVDKFSSPSQLSMKILAMFIGELEFGDHPFARGLFFNYFVFALFVFLIVIVMMNLLTGMALRDVQDIANDSFDATWNSLTMYMSNWEDALITLQKYFSATRNMKRMFYKLHKVRLVVFPNTKKHKQFLKEGEYVITERSIRQEVKNICLARMEASENEPLKPQAAEEVEFKKKVLISLDDIKVRLDRRIPTVSRETTS